MTVIAISVQLPWRAPSSRWTRKPVRLRIPNRNHDSGCGRTSPRRVCAMLMTAASTASATERTPSASRHSANPCMTPPLHGVFDPACADGKRNMVEIAHRMIEANGLRIHVAEAGEGPLVLLCHGFPESWYSWRHQLQALAEAGYHAVAPDMRGYGQTDRPEAIDQYTLLHLT